MDLPTIKFERKPSNGDAERWPIMTHRQPKCDRTGLAGVAIPFTEWTRNVKRQTATYIRRPESRRSTERHRQQTVRPYSSARRRTCRKDLQFREDVCQSGSPFKAASFRQRDGAGNPAVLSPGISQIGTIRLRSGVTPTPTSMRSPRHRSRWKRSQFSPRLRRCYPVDWAR